MSEDSIASAFRNVWALHIAGNDKDAVKDCHTQLEVLIKERLAEMSIPFYGTPPLPELLSMCRASPPISVDLMFRVGVLQSARNIATHQNLTPPADIAFIAILAGIGCLPHLGISTDWFKQTPTPPESLKAVFGHMGDKAEEATLDGLVDYLNQLSPEERDQEGVYDLHDTFKEVRSRALRLSLQERVRFLEQSLEMRDSEREEILGRMGLRGLLSEDEGYRLSELADNEKQLEAELRRLASQSHAMLAIVFSRMLND